MNKGENTDTFDGILHLGGYLSECSKLGRITGLRIGAMSSTYSKPTNVPISHAPMVLSRAGSSAERSCEPGVSGGGIMIASGSRAERHREDTHI